MEVILIIVGIIIVLLFGQNHGFKKEPSKDKQNKEKEKNNDVSNVDTINQSEPTINSDTDVSHSISISSNYDDWDASDYEEQAKIHDKYVEFQKTRPDYETQFGRSFKDPKYTDEFDTHTGFTLRELLLLVWWGKVKKGRLITSRIPKYFIYDYDLNAPKITQKFIDMGLISNKNERYILSDKAKEIVDSYSDLWSMHQAGNLPICLDKDFLNWNHGKLLINFYENEIEFQKKLIDYHKRSIVFYKENPKLFFKKEMQKDYIESANKSILNAKNDIDRYNKLIQAIN